MRRAEWLQIAAAGYFVALSLIRRLPRSRRLRVGLLAAVVALVNLALAWLAGGAPRTSAVLRDWAPAALMLLPFYQAGLLLQGTDQRLQRMLAEIDDRILQSLRIRAQAIERCRLLQLYLELAYSLVYPLIPIAVGVLCLTHRRNAIEHFWTVVLTAAFTSYALTPFVAALPPRSTGTMQFPEAPIKLRSFNVWVLKHASIHVVTFPSGHVACAMVIALFFLSIQPAVGIVFLVLALSITAATIVGGYHYISDALTALAVALLSFVTWRVFAA